MNSHFLLQVMTGHREISMMSSQKGRSRSTVQPGSSTPQQSPKGLDILLHRCLLIATLFTTAREKTQPKYCSTGKRVIKNMVPIQNGIPFIFKEK